MIDWLKRDPRQPPTLEMNGRTYPVIIRRHAAAKRMILRLSANGDEVCVTIPNWGRTADATEFAAARIDWLSRQISDLPERTPVISGSAIRFRGESLTVCHDPDAPRKPELGTETLRLGGPQASISNRVKRWLEAQARDHLSADLEEYCQIAGKEPPKLALSNAKRRWGSCALDGAIRINWRLIMAPDHVRRSVVAHEVAHLSHFDHSPSFHAHLAEIYERDITIANDWLKREGRGLYSAFG